MEATTSFHAFFALFMVFSSSAQGALNINKTLSPFPELSTFNELLTKTKLVDQINKLNSVTILAFDNGAAASIAGKPDDVVKKIISNHIVLEYFDLQRLTERVMEKKSVLLTTMFQSSGEAKNNAGFVNASLVGEGENVFGSGVKGSPLDSKLANETVTLPYTISVFQITKPIIAPGIEDAKQASPPADAKEASSPADAKEAPSPAEDKDAASPAGDKESDAKTPASGESPAGEPSGEHAEAPTKESSASSLAQALGLGVAAVFISSMLAL